MVATGGTHSSPDGVHQAGHSKSEHDGGVMSEASSGVADTAGNVRIQTEADAQRPQSSGGGAAAAVRVLGGGLRSLVKSVARAPAEVLGFPGSDEVAESRAAEAPADCRSAVSLAISLTGNPERPVTVILRAHEKGVAGASSRSNDCSKQQATEAAPSLESRPSLPAPPATSCNISAAPPPPEGDELTAEERRELRVASQIADQLRQVCANRLCWPINPSAGSSLLF